MGRRPPSSPLFPYTTLFRSEQLALWALLATTTTSGMTPHETPPSFTPRMYPQFETRRDRKSTRLNSSHSQISYAVFCLKKKNSDLIRHSRRSPHRVRLAGQH